MKLSYPPAPKNSTVDEYFGILVADPYRPLEDLGAPATQAWVRAQNQLTFDYLAQAPGRERLHARLREIYAHNRYSIPRQAGGRVFFTEGDGRRNQDVLLVCDSRQAQPRVLLDPNSWSTDGTVAMAYHFDVSLDGRWLLYGQSTGGSDWVEWHALSVETGEVLPDVLRWCKFAAFWNRDASGIYYTRLPEPAPGDEYTCQALNPATCFHRLGEAQDADELLFSLPEHPDWLHAAFVNEERDLLIHQILERGSDHTRLYFQELNRADAPLLRVLDDNDAIYQFVTNYGRRLLIQTTLNAPNSRVIELDLDNPGHANWREVIPESRLALMYVTTAGDYLFAHYLKDAHWVVFKYQPDGTPLGEVRTAGQGLASGFRGRKDETEVFYAYQDMATPPTVFSYDTETGRAEPFRRTAVDIDLARYEMRQQFYRAPDGTAIPLFLLSRRGLKLDGSNPTILYGYGGFSAPLLPYFDSTRFIWLELGGVYAVACIRGGGEYGEDWHQAAVKTRRQVCFDDFIAGAEYLFDQGYTCPERLALFGESNGGALIGAVINQRPDLCRVALINVGVLDMLRNSQWGFGPLWEREYGSVGNAEEFQVLLGYSPYHNVRAGVRYPAVLVRTGDTDDRVMPAHSYKYVARLQARQAADGPPVLLRVETSAGHGMGKPLDKRVRELADMYSFVMGNMGLEYPE